MKFNEEDKITCEGLKDNQYYKLSEMDTAMLGWDCDLYENDKITDHNLELNLDLPRYTKKKNE